MRKGQVVNMALQKARRWLNIWMSQFLVLRLKNRRPARGRGRGIVVIKIDAIGDFLIWLDSAAQYKMIYPGQEITLVCNTACAAIADNTGYFDKVVSIQSRRFESDNKYRKEVWDSFRDKAFHMLLQTEYSRTVDMDLLAMNIPADEKTAFVSDESRLNLSRYMTFKGIRRKLDRIYDRLIPPGGENLMELERNAVFIRGLGHDFKAGYPELPQTHAEEVIKPSGPYTVIFPGGSSGKKMWPIERYAQVGEYVVRKKDMDICLCGGKDEAYLYKQFVDAMADKACRDRVHDMLGKTTLTGLAEIIRGACLLISNDTSGIHFAAAVNTKGICIFGEFAYGRFLPYRCERDCSGHEPVIVCSAGKDCAGCVYGSMTSECKAHLVKTGRYQCLDEVSVEQVIKEIG